MSTNPFRQGFANEEVKGAFLDIEAMAKGTRCANYFYHADLNPGENESLTEEQWMRAVNTLERHLGLEAQPRFVIEHEKKGRVHRHVIWSRIDADTMTARPDLAHLRQTRGSRAGNRTRLRSGGGRLGAGKRPRGPAPGSQSVLTPSQVKAEITALWRECDSGTAFMVALRAVQETQMNR